jgi:tRNA acetyltransferase TAN1
LNLIITCARHLETETRREITDILEKMGDSEPIISITNMSGILTAETKIEPIEVIKKIKEMILDEPWCIRYCLRVIPVQKITETKIESIDDGISDLIKLISNEESYRISIEKRNSNISSQELISNIAKKIKNKVSLEFPDKIILIEVLGNKTGIAIVKKTDILSVEKTKRSISE